MSLKHDSAPYSISQEMTRCPSVVGPKTTVSEAAALMKSGGFRHLPVVDHGVVIGILSDRDLREPMILNDAMELFVTDVMSANPYCVPSGTSLKEVALTMANRKCGSAVVIQPNGKVVGIFTTTDALYALSRLLTDEKDGLHLSAMGIDSFLHPGVMLPM